MLMEHRYTQGRPSWTPSGYSSTPSTSATASTSLIYDVLRPATYSSENSQYQPPQYPQDQDNNYRYPYNEPPRLAFAPLPHPPRDDPLAPSANRLRYPSPSLPRPMIGGSVSPHFRTIDKPSPVSAVVTPAYVIAKPGGLTTPKRATDEERRAKHREAQRRFVKRKKIEMLQLKQLAVELEKRHDLLQVVSERETLARENQVLMQQLEAQKEKAVEEDKQEEANIKKEVPEKGEHSRPEMWEARTFEW
ncbi:hypothetical protein PC129_g14965 [Phytophthora cactorum]|uniref:BZIP domain-containing protein n=1 Tax=Phytophthora cactorum TaxID=29920 RepID=A0A329RQN6_9STRA|nr:hypothetical protein Pcac1_g13323 [Phytophthora cactorum]KAG2811344.1 hypothetical protein PC112_g15647 [Phytophthora cactorum]KAG2812681.1 hypothetical protein PC111_g14712 [Phytophthora cactorum]KAG2859827.1 hypothetical protein PC113_g8577 [Phytophthora cactorum]KAG2912999.1 hypothetical protein PC114_g8707 [Phytophthora cactorum]